MLLYLTLLYKEEIFFFQDDPRRKIEVSCIDTCLGLNTPCFIKTNTLVTWAYFGTHTFQIVFGLPKPFTSSLFFIQFRESCNKSFFSNGFKDNQDLLLLRTHDLQQKWNFRLFSDRIRRGLQKKKQASYLHSPSSTMEVIYIHGSSCSSNSHSSPTMQFLESYSKRIVMMIPWIMSSCDSVCDSLDYILLQLIMQGLHLILEYN